MEATCKTFTEYRKSKIREMLDTAEEMEKMGHSEEEIEKFLDSYEIPSYKTAMGY
jgi:hypothetical protein